jgi:hypothetical protein
MLFIATGGRHNALITFLAFHDHRLILFTNCLEDVFSILRWLFGSQGAVVYGPLPSVVYVVLLGVT